jgi:hypothetical protein
MRITKKSRAGIVAGVTVGVLAIAGVGGAIAANAADSTPSPATSSSAKSLSDGLRANAPQQGATDADGRGQHAAEEALTGDAASKTEAAVKAKYPDATIDRMEKDSDGRSVYEAHITKADGTHVTVLLDADFTVTGEDAMGPGGHGGPGGHRGPGAQTDQSEQAA